jgi:hypothetical protein
MLYSSKNRVFIVFLQKKIDDLKMDDLIFF